MPRFANNITRTEAIQLDLSIDRNEPGAESRDRPFGDGDFLFLNRARSPSPPLNDEDCLVVNPVLFSNLPQMVVVFCGVFQQRIADVSC